MLVLVLALVLKSGSPSVYKPFLGWLDVSAAEGSENGGSTDKGVVVGKDGETKVYYRLVTNNPAKLEDLPLSVLLK